MDEKELAKFAKQNIYGEKIVIGMGAGTISNWMRNLPKLIKMKLDDLEKIEFSR